MGKNNTTDYRFKLLYAIAIIMVVCGHCNGGGISLEIGGIFRYGGLHLPLFMFSSGYFYRDRAAEHPKEFILKKCRNFLLPLYVYNIVYGVVLQVFHYCGFTMGRKLTLYNILIAPINNGHQFVFNMGGWYLMPLFMVEICTVLFRYFLLRNDIRLSETACFAAAVLAGLAGNQLACMGYYEGWWLPLVRMLYFLPFFGLGIYYRRVLEKNAGKVSPVLYFGLIFACKFLIKWRFGKYLSYTPSWCNDFEEGPLMPIVNGFLGIAFWFRICEMLTPFLGRTKVVREIADNTFSIMMNQFMGFMIVKTAYALIFKYTSHFQNFSWKSYKTDIWWYYTPKGIRFLNIFYLLMGILFPIAVQKCINMAKGILPRKKASFTA